MNSPSGLSGAFPSFIGGMKDRSALTFRVDESSETKNSGVPMRRTTSEGEGGSPVDSEVHLEAGGQLESSGLERHKEPDKERLCLVWPTWFVIAVSYN